MSKFILPSAYLPPISLPSYVSLAMEITSLSQAMQLHAQIVKSPDLKNRTRNLTRLFTFAALSPAGDLSYAQLIIDSLSTQNSFFYNTMIRAYSQGSDPTQALRLFISMLHQPTSPPPDKFTYPFLLKSCARLKKIRVGKQIHGLLYKSGTYSDQYVMNGLIHMYSGCGESGLAYEAFGRMRERDVVSWTSMIDGFVDNDRAVDAIRLFEEMMEEGVEPNEATVVSVMRACADAGAIGAARRVRGVVEERKIGLQANVRTALIDMYAKCGSIGSAREVFDGIKDKDVFAWTAMISGLASHGLCAEAVTLFDKMEVFGLRPDERTMTAVLSACRNAGWVSEGFAYFRGMQGKYGVKPTIQHYGCMVDLLARAGHLDEAEEFIRKMPIEPDVVLWRTLIWACKIHCDIDRRERLMKDIDLLKMDFNDCGSYVLLGNVYASAGKWHDKAKLRGLMNRKGLSKPPGCSRIEVDGKVHEFTAGDSGHFDAQKIYAKLDEVEERLRAEEYDPKLSEVMLEIDDEEKSFQLHHHSEKLAVAYGLIKTSPGAEIRIVKNLRSCEDCHSVMKLISKIYQRCIIVRDRIRFHHFINGDCSCKDYW